MEKLPVRTHGEYNLFIDITRKHTVLSTIKNAG